MLENNQSFTKIPSMEMEAALGLSQLGNNYFFQANWRVPKGIKTLISTRNGGVSKGVFASLNVGLHVGDSHHDVIQNRAIIQTKINQPVAYLNQTHSTDIVLAKEVVHSNPPANADASIASMGDKVACAVMTADCLPVLLCDKAGTKIAAVHAGWRGLSQGIIEKTIDKMQINANDVLVYLGPAIGPEAFEVGEEVKEVFCQMDKLSSDAFIAISEQKYLADIYALATRRLNKIGVSQIFGGTFCTVLDRKHFFSYRRDGQTGRMLSAIWFE